MGNLREVLSGALQWEQMTHQHQGCVSTAHRVQISRFWFLLEKLLSESMLRL